MGAISYQENYTYQQDSNTVYDSLLFKYSPCPKGFAVIY